jgi:transcriptional regulator with XRE-family HTH domain
MSLPNHIRFWREQRGWNLQQLADAAGTTRSQIDKLERGLRRLTVDWMVRLSGPLGCDPRSLMLEQTLATLSVSGSDLPIYSLKDAGKTSRRLLKSTRPSGNIKRPDFIKDPQAYVLLIATEALSPVLRCGQMAILSPAAKPHDQQAVLILAKDGGLILGLYNGETADGSALQLQTTQLSKTILFAKSKLKALHPIIATWQP